MNSICCMCGSKYHDTQHCKWGRVENIEPIRYDIERIEQALNGPSYMMPHGLSRKEIVEFLNKAAKELK